MNLGFLSAIYMNFFIPISEKKKDFKCNLIKCGASLIGVFLFGYLLIKIYEVPVYVTKIRTVSMNSHNEPGDGLNIRLVRDYDRSDKGLAFSDSPERSSRAKGNIFLGGIFISGKFHYQADSWGDKLKTCDSIRDVARMKMSQFGKKEIEDPQIIYISSLVSNRQDFGIHYSSVGEDHYATENSNMSVEFYNGKYMVNKTYCYKDYFWYANRKDVNNGDGRLFEEYFVASKDDSVLNIDFVCSPYTYNKPNVIRTLEDISKIIEVIEIGYSHFDHTKFAGTWSLVDSLEIDYVGPAEFSEPLDPLPDKKTLSSILYTDKDKIRQIGKYGLRYHVKFPDMENIQEARIFIVSGMLTGLAALFFRFLFFSLRNIWQYYGDMMDKKFYFCMVILIICLLLSLLVLLIPSNISVLDIRQY